MPYLYSFCLTRLKTVQDGRSSHKVDRIGDDVPGEQEQYRLSFERLEAKAEVVRRLPHNRFMAAVEDSGIGSVTVPH